MASRGPRKHRQPKDLFGQAARSRRPRWEWTLEQSDRQTLAARAARLRWLKRTMPRGLTMAMPLETWFVFEEARLSFLAGCDVGTILLCEAFIEHLLSARLAERGNRKEAKAGLAAIVDCCRKNHFVDASLLERIDKLRQVRNPFVHLKAFDHAHGLTQRTLALKQHPHAVVERDARQSLETLFLVVLRAML